MYLKPEMSKEMLRLLELRNEMNRKRPEFHRQEWFRYKKLGDAWRKPRGKHSKLREKRGYRHAFVESGYRGPKLVRYLHPSGFREVYVTHISQLDKVDPKTQAIRISATVGKKKKLEILEKAKSMGIKVLNGGI